MSGIVPGALLMGYVVAGLFFLKFWSASKDRLFAMFAACFWLLAVQRFAIMMTAERMEDQTIFYLLRLFAFLLIIVAVIQKNRE